MTIEERYYKHAGEFLDRCGHWPGYKALLAHFTWQHLFHETKRRSC